MLRSHLISTTIENRYLSLITGSEAKDDMNMHASIRTGQVRYWLGLIMRSQILAESPTLTRSKYHDLSHLFRSIFVTDCPFLHITCASSSNEKLIAALTAQALACSAI